MKFKTNAKWLERQLAKADDQHIETAGISLEELKVELDRRTVTPAAIVSSASEFGKVIRFARERKGLTQKALADVAQLDPEELLALETESDARPSPRALVNLADALELSRSKLKDLAGFVVQRNEPANPLKFAAHSNRIDSISDDEYESIRALVEVLSQK